MNPAVVGNAAAGHNNGNLFDGERFHRNLRAGCATAAASSAITFMMANKLPSEINIVGGALLGSLVGVLVGRALGGNWGPTILMAVSSAHFAAKMYLESILGGRANAPTGVWY